MQKPTLVFAFLSVLSLFPSAHAEWIDLGGDPFLVRIVEADHDRTVIELTLEGFDAVPVEIDGETYHHIQLTEESVQQVAGMPALPDVRRSLIIPDDRAMRVTLLDGDFVDVPNLPVAPSKGHLLRTVDPATVPYKFDPFYDGDGIYPATSVEGHEPYILRDYRGMVVDLNPFQYTPSTRTLRVYTRMRVEVAPVGLGSVNVLERRRPLDRVDPQFAKLYREHFLNGGSSRYTPILEEGGLLIITYDAFLPNVEPLYHWKLQKGIPTQLVTLSEIGTTPDAIKQYIQAEYDNGDLAYVLLVGDSEQVPTFTWGSGGSDPTYALVAGADDYPDIFVGRFSAEVPGHVDTQVERTITYERDQVAGEVWPQYGTGIASNEGPGHHGEYDNEHMDLIREDLLGYGYLGVDQIYQPTGTPEMVSAALNEGRGIVNYTGHGSTTYWGSQSAGWVIFRIADIDTLRNVNRLPFLNSVACLTGNFTGETCFGEAWLRATHNGQPTGGIASYMSSILQSWDPPMDAQDEAIDLLVSDQMRTVGGLWYNSSCFMIDVNGADGVSMFRTWILFGDPSVAVRTKTAETMTVNHIGSLMLGNDQYDIQVPGVTGALCALYADGILYGTAYTDEAGTATITLDPVPTEPMSLTLTVTAYNKVTHVSAVEVIPAEGPYLIISEVLYMDEDGDGRIDAGGGAEMRIKLRNVGVETATAIRGILSTEDEYTDIGEDEQDYPDIAPGEEAWCVGLYAFGIAPECPDEHPVQLHLQIEGEERLAWEGTIGFVVHAPIVSVEAIEIDDALGGNGNYRLDPGETALVSLTLHNAGSGHVYGVFGDFVCTHPQISVLVDRGYLEELNPGESGLLAPAFEVSVDTEFMAYEADFDLVVTGSYEFTETYEIRLPVGGFYETVEQGAGEWVHYVVGSGFSDQWHVSSQRNHTFGGAQSWKCGDQGAGDYANLLDAGLETPAVEVGSDGELRFWMWIDAEESAAYPERAYDGGLVEVSIDGGPFTQITPECGYTHTIREGSTPGPFPEDTPVFSGSHAWQEVVFDLSGISGELAFRFRFGSDGAATGEGWYIDDVEILGMVALADVDAAGSVRLALAPTQPNPFAASTRIRFSLPATGPISLAVFDVSGRLVRTLHEGPLPAGDHLVAWEGTDDAGHRVANGLYYCRLQADQAARERSVILLR